MPKWLDAEAVKTLHEVALDPGDETGLNPGSDLEGAVARPKQWHNYKGVDSLTKLAALYGVAIAKAHAFRDGNKRTALLAVDAFLDQNGVRFNFQEAQIEGYSVFLKVARDEMDYEELATWIEGHLQVEKTILSRLEALIGKILGWGD